MAYTTINKSSLHMNTKLYTGNGSTQSITGVGFKPDWTWIKPRTGTYSHNLTDIVRGVGKGIFSDLTVAEYNYGTGTDGSVRTFDSDGFSLGSATQVNPNGVNIASWNWKAGNSQGSSNTAGSINTTYTSVNTTAGFSISQYTGTGSNATIGHGLGAIPKMIIVKKLSGADSWTIYHASLGATKKINFDTGAAGTQSDRWNDTSPTNTLFSIGTNGSVNASGATYIAYCFSDVQGFSKMGSYVGNGSSDGTFCYTGFKPAFVMTKNSSAGSTNWSMMDNKRFGYNVTLPYVYANTTAAEQTNQNVNNIDILSNGFKCRESDANRNASGASYIYMAFGQTLVGTNNIPNNAF